MAATPYEQLEDRFERLFQLGQVEAILHWDTAAIMPSGAAEARGRQLAALRAVRHGMLTAAEVGDLLAAAESIGEGGEADRWRAANLREMRRAWVHATALGEDLVLAFSKATSACETVWRQARRSGDFAAVLPYLEEVLSLVRQVAAAKAERLSLGLYDALLDEWEPEGRSAQIDPLFQDLEAFLPGFLAQVMEHQARQPAAITPQGPFPVENQRALGVRLMKMLGFDFDHGRLDVSHHPFCGGTADDVRITTRYDENDFTSALMGVLHETGHALYELGLPRKWRGRPVGDARGMAIHESQSLLIEMQVCRSAEFLAFAAPMMKEAFSGSPGNQNGVWATGNLYRLYTRVEPSFIRVEADEVTYPVHVILRYHLEKAMIEGRLEARDLPAAWNEGMDRMLGLTPASDREGCLQDIHWYDGAWGYFPTYTLGAMTAAQLFDGAKKADPAITGGIAKGDFAPLLSWLRENVHAKASSLSGAEIIHQATGRPLDPLTFKAHLKSRYLEDGGD